MAKRDIEVHEPLSEKREKLDIDGGYDQLEASEKKAFDSLLLPKNSGKKYSDEDIRSGINKTMEEGIKESKLQLSEAEEAQKIQKELLQSMEGKTQKEMIREYARFRTELLVVLAIDSGKDQKPNEDNKKQEQATKENEQKNEDYFSGKVKRLGEILREGAKKNQEERQKAVKGAQEGSKKDAVKSEGEAFEALSKWPK